ncbi:Aste57867_10567 [Aphanomyces stellatus]|uniref:Aste57867_10567 protein n=1 Tax=Aphanomyces stellatus TaxID=120398 RepID=A0A485KQT3_9STRA|nr:hypothetical protein As57867_010527 [Aphanomyces stellatus]VFT87440.1 Aste57867_10567 [Aphanomyces stellatus]
MSSSNDAHNSNLAGDGASIFAQNCTDCHAYRSMPGQNLRGAKGPSLDNIVDKRAAAGTFNYSNALKGANVTWDEKTLFQFLLAPKQYIKGTKMNHPGIKDPTKRNALIAYLKEQK